MAENVLLGRLQEQRLKAVGAARELAERVAAGDTLSGEDEAAYARANDDVNRYDGLLREEVKRVEEERSINDAVEAAYRKANAPTEPKKEGPTIAERMRTDLEASRKGETRNGGVYGQIPDMAYDKESRTLTVAGPSTGGKLVPETLVAALYQKLFDDSAVLQTSPTVLRTESGEKLKLPRLTSRGALTTGAVGAGSARLNEGSQIQKSEGTFDQVELDAYKFGQISQVSRELVEDGVLDVEGLLGRVLGANMANYLGVEFTSGSGTSAPNGILTLVPAGNKVAGATGIGGVPGTTANDVDKAFDVISKLKPGHRKNGKWLVNDLSLYTLRKLKMNGVYAWEPNLQGAGQPDQFLGYPILSDPNITAIGVGAGANITMVFADFSQYYVRFVRDVRVEWSMEYAWDSDLISVKAVVRADGDAIDADAFAAFTRPAT